MKKTQATITELLIWVGPLIVVPPMVGYVIGRLVGESNTPVVATALPLIFGLLGVFSLQAVRKRTLKSELIDELLETEVVSSQPDTTKESFEKQLRRDSSSTSANLLPLLWSIGVALFCLTFMAGKSHGVAVRIPSYSEFDLSKFDKLSAIEITDLYNLRLYFMSVTLPKDEFEKMFDDVLIPVLNKTEGVERQNELNTTIQRLVGTYEPPKPELRRPEQTPRHIVVKFEWPNSTVEFPNDDKQSGDSVKIEPNEKQSSAPKPSAGPIWRPIEQGPAQIDR